MAYVSDNGLYTIDYGSSAWRVILNDNITKTVTPTKMANGITSDFSLTGDFNLAGNLNVSGTTLMTGIVTSQNDIKFSDSSKGVILKDRSDGNNYRIYTDNGSLKVEKV